MNRDGFSYRVQRLLQRIMDIVISAAALVLLSAVLLLIALMIRLESPGGSIYRHRRIGKDGRPFALYKFRSMVVGANDGQYQQYLKDLIASASQREGRGLPYLKMQDDPRITRLGRVLRAYYLDEFPQLINVLRGEMSLVGPRPHVQLEVDSYTPEQRRRLTVKPGVTGPWQVEGKAHYTFTELLQSDLDYIDHWTLGRDVEILFKTFVLLLRGGERFWAHVAGRIASKKPVPATRLTLTGSDSLVSPVQPPLPAAAGLRTNLAQPVLPAGGSQPAQPA